MNKELDVAKSIIRNHLNTNLNIDSLNSICEIDNGNKELLLAHIEAIISIFKKAKEQLEEEMKGNKKWKLTFITPISEIFNYFNDKQKDKKGTVRQLVWCKTNPSPMNGEYLYLSGIENAVWFKKKGYGQNKLQV